MPYTFNGIGSWYYGKKNEYRYTGTCENCGAVTQLNSYDTTEFFVLLFVPIFPLGEKRVMDHCPGCRKHRVMQLKDWENYKKQSADELYSKWIQEPNNLEKTIELLQAIVYFRDTDRLNSVSRDIRNHCAHNADIMNQLGLAHTIFNQYEEAEADFTSSLSVKQDIQVSENLAEAYMRGLKPDKARPLVFHILKEKNSEKIFLMYLLIESYQRIGDHRSAIEVIEEFENSFTQMKNEKALLKYRKISERNYDKPNKIKGFLLSNNQGKKETSDLSFIAPKLIFPVLLTLAFVIYTISAFVIGLTREVYLVNGLDIPYTIDLNGDSKTLQPMSKQVIRLQEGTIKVSIKDLNTEDKNLSSEIKTPFWTRPFNKSIFIMNPDKAAVLLWQETQYEKYPEANLDYEPPYQYYAGEFFYKFDSVDYLFEDFPKTITTSEGRKIKKTQLIQLNKEAIASNYSYIFQNLEPNEAKAYAKASIMQGTDEEVTIYTLMAAFHDDSNLDFLKPLLAERPVRINLHRAYQQHMEMYNPSYDLEGEYSQYLEKEKNNKDLYYLLSRILDDSAKAEDLLIKSVEGSNPCAFGYYGLGYKRLAEAQFDDALTFLQKAVEALPEQISFRSVLYSTLLAKGEFDSLLLEYKAEQDNNPFNIELAAEEVRLHMCKGDSESAQKVISEYVASIGEVHKENAQISRDYLEGVFAYCSNDETTYAEKIGKIKVPEFEFQNAFIKGEYDKASAIAKDNGLDGYNQLMLYLAQDNPEDASRYLANAIESFRSGDKTERVLADYLSGDKNFAVDEVKSIVIPPETKCIAMAAFGKLKPDHSKELFSLAQKLNYNKKFPYIFISKVAGN